MEGLVPMAMRAGAVGDRFIAELRLKPAQHPMGGTGAIGNCSLWGDHSLLDIRVLMQGKGLGERRVIVKPLANGKIGACRIVIEGRDIEAAGHAHAIEPAQRLRFHKHAELLDLRGMTKRPASSNPPKSPATR